MRRTTFIPVLIAALIILMAVPAMAGTTGDPYEPVCDPATQVCTGVADDSGKPDTPEQQTTIPQAQTAAQAQTGLASTGLDTPVLVLLSLGFLMAGGLVFLLTRRRA